MSTQERIIAVIKKVSGQDVAPDPEESLFDSGYLDSFALTDMVAELEKAFGVSIPDSDLSPRRFESVAKIESYLQKHAN
jgi:acyl carrier protein